MQNFYFLLENKFWVSSPESIKKAERKAYQLLKAKEAGFLLPDTLISNDPDEAKKFYETHNSNIVAKPISHGGYGDNNDKAIFANDLSGKEVDSIFANVKLAPLIFQQKVDKSYDVRVNVFGNQFFAYKITTKDNIPIFDWRTVDFHQLKYTRMDLDRNLEEKILRFVNSLNLKFGAFDFSYDKNDNPYFLEINPNGQWGWIDIVNQTNILTDALIELLTSHES